MTRELQSLTGTIEGIRVYTADAWGTARLVDGKARHKVVGKLFTVRDGDAVEVRGHWTDHPKYGRQFKIHELLPSRPSTVDGLVKWMASRLPQMGEKRARAVVDRFGAADLWTVFEERPDDLLEVPGITPERRDEIVEAYNLHRAERDRMVLFKSWGLTDGQIGNVLAKWGDLAETRIRKNPYELAQHVRGFGFQRADSVARAMGIEPHDPVRLCAGVMQALTTEHERGHTYVPAGKLVALAAKLLKVHADHLWDATFSLRDSGAFVGGKNRARLPRIHRAERECAMHMQRLLGRGRKAA